jgi:phosphoglycolate phosphatase
MVEDRLNSNVLLGTDKGLKSVLVLSGVTLKKEFLSAAKTMTPDFYTDTINDFSMNVPVPKET